MASADGDIALSNCTGVFNLDDVILCNVSLVNVGRYVVNSFANVYDFCCELKLLNKKRIVAVVVSN